MESIIPDILEVYKLKITRHFLASVINLNSFASASRHDGIVYLLCGIYKPFVLNMLKPVNCISHVFLAEFVFSPIRFITVYFHQPFCGNVSKMKLEVLPRCLIASEIEI